MNEYRIYFEIYGKKLKTTIQARNETEARDKVKSKLNILKVEKIQEPPKTNDEGVQKLWDFFGF